MQPPQSLRFADLRVSNHRAKAFAGHAAAQLLHSEHSVGNPLQRAGPSRVAVDCGPLIILQPLNNMDQNFPTRPVLDPNRLEVLRLLDYGVPGGKLVAAILATRDWSALAGG
jgi:hypothetical protein